MAGFSAFKPGEGMKSKNRITRVALAKGQLWKLEDSLIQIVAIGKSLTHYKRFNNPNQKGVPTKLERTQTVETYLKAKGATLIREPNGD